MLTNIPVAKSQRRAFFSGNAVYRIIIYVVGFQSIGLSCRRKVLLKFRIISRVDGLRAAVDKNPIDKSRFHSEIIFKASFPTPANLPLSLPTNLSPLPPVNCHLWFRGCYYKVRRLLAAARWLLPTAAVCLHRSSTRAIIEGADGRAGDNRGRRITGARKGCWLPWLLRPTNVCWCYRSSRRQQFYSLWVSGWCGVFSWGRGYI